MRGEVVFPATAAPFAKLLVQVEDVSFADAPSVVVGEQELNVGELEGGGGVRFRSRFQPISSTLATSIRCELTSTRRVRVRSKSATSYRRAHTPSSPEATETS